MMEDFDKKSAEWDTPQRMKLAAILYGKISEVVPLNRSMSVLEYGCGTGLLGLQMADRVGFIDFVDTSEGMLDMLREKISRLKLANTEVFNVDLSSSDGWHRKYDLVFCSMVLHHISDYKAAIARFASLLNAGGTLAIIDLFTEDGSFHGSDFDGHKGFDIQVIDQVFRDAGLSVFSAGEAAHIKVDNGRRYPLFMVAGRR